MLKFAFRKCFVAAVLFGATVVAHAVTFTNVTISGTPQLVLGSSFATGATDIDFTLPNAVVGDFQPLRQGVITITYEASSAQAMIMNQLILSVLGGVSGSGMIQFSEVIEDLVTPGVIGSLPTTTITNNNQLPFVANIAFSRPSTHIKVKKEFFLFAQPDTQALDLARLALVEQNLTVVPEPASMAALGLGLAAIAARRRRK